MSDPTIHRSISGASARAPRRAYILYGIILGSALTAIVSIVIARNAMARMAAMGSQIQLADPSGHTRVRVAAEKDGARIEMLDDRAVAGISLYHKDTQAPNLSMQRRDSVKPAIELDPPLGLNALEVRGRSGGVAHISDLQGIAAVRTRGSTWFGAGRLSLSMSTEKEGDRPQSFEIRLDAVSSISGRGRLQIRHRGLVEDLGDRLAHAHRSE